MIWWHFFVLTTRCRSVMIAVVVVSDTHTHTWNQWCAPAALVNTYMLIFFNNVFILYSVSKWTKNLLISRVDSGNLVRRAHLPFPPPHSLSLSLYRALVCPHYWLQKQVYRQRQTGTCSVLNGWPPHLMAVCLSDTETVLMLQSAITPFFAGCPVTVGQQQQLRLL